MDFDFDFQFKKQVIGIDEVGRGSWAGPVMASAALIDYQMPVDKRLDDSKKLPIKKRKEIFKTLTKNNTFGLGIVSNHEIDKIGILMATFKAMEIALIELFNKIINPFEKIILIDGNIMPEFKKNFLSEIKLIKRGDTISPSIAAASIFAKCSRDNLMFEMDKKYTGYEFSKNMGYGTKYHREKLISSGPTQFHRMTFKPMKDLNN